jgi:hypothetical protein
VKKLSFDFQLEFSIPLSVHAKKVLIAHSSSIPCPMYPTPPGIPPYMGGDIGVTLPVNELSAEQLEELCDDFRKRLFESVNKTDPAHERPIWVPGWKEGYRAPEVVRLLSDLKDRLDNLVINPRNSEDYDEDKVLVDRIESMLGD